MNSNFQNEIPKSRINITLDIETNGSQKKTELPLKLLILGKFSDMAEHAPITLREKMDVTRSNLNHTLKNLSPSLTYPVPNQIKKGTNELQVQLNFNQYQDFHPDQVVMQVPELRRLVSARNLLKELKANMIDNKTLRTELEKIISDQQCLKNLQNELKNFMTDQSQKEIKQ
jgi:type VI secretion system protein ImpB